MAEGDHSELRERVRALFVGELDEGVRALNEGLVRLPQTSGDERVALVRELFRVAHGIKGSALAAEVPDAAQRARVIESTLAELRDGLRAIEPDVVAGLLVEVDGLDDVRAAMTSAPEPTGAEAPSAGAAEAGAPADRSAVRERATVRVSAAKLDALVDRAADIAAASDLVATLARELVAASSSEWGDAPAGVRRHAALADSAVRTSRELARLSAEVANAAAELTFQPLSEAYEGLRRAVHDLSRDTGTEVRLELLGGDVEVDREVVAALREPLLHLVRNAVAHGIELPEERLAAGKPGTGEVRVRARLAGSVLEVQVTDDGRGLDPAAIQAAARRSGVEVDGTDEAELAFVAGVTTSGAVSDAAGRGVGLDAVRARMRSIGGEATLDTEPGRGTTVTLRSPVTLALVEVLHVRCGGEIVQLPASSIDHLVRVPATEVHDASGRATYLHQGTSYPVVDLGAAAGLGGSAADRPVVDLVLLGGGARRAALAVDELVGESEVVVKRPPARLAGSPTVLGVAVRPDGSASLVLNPAACAHAALAATGDSTLPSAPAAPSPPHVLLAEDTFTTRMLEVGMLEGAGYAVTAVADGAAAWELLQRERFDVLVSDVHMPGIDGIELTRRVRSSERLGTLPVVLVTSLGSPEDRASGLDAGATAYVVKSELAPDTLAEVIERLL